MIEIAVNPRTTPKTIPTIPPLLRLELDERSLEEDVRVDAGDGLVLELELVEVDNPLDEGGEVDGAFDEADEVVLIVVDAQ